MFWKLPPVRRAVRFQIESFDPSSDPLCGRRPQFFGSGTQALAAALLACKNERPGATEVLLPAYGCPDLVAACEFAGLEARLVDLVDDGTWSVNMTQLRDMIGKSTAAALAVNLFGVGDDAASLSVIANTAGVPVVQDSAQALSKKTASHWHAPYVVISFGRGKPFNLLGGGALLTKDAMRSLALEVATASAVRETLLHGTGAALAFNAVTHPRVYWLASRLPGLGVGATVFNRLDTLTTPSVARRRRMECVLRAGLSSNAPLGVDWSVVAAGWSHLGIRPISTQPQDPQNLLRYGLLAANEQQRDRIIERLEKLGAGVSTMYGVPLNSLPNIPASVSRQGPFPNAESFARRLFTLPTHGFVNETLMEQVDEQIRVVR